MIRTPAQYQLDPMKKPGQVTSPYDMWPTKSHGRIINDVTLADYIARKEVAYAPRLTFEQWFKCYNELNGLPPAYEVAKAAWNASKENT